jgi:transketolase
MDYLDEKEIKQLNDMAYEIRKLTVEMIACAQWGHIGGSFSLAEILSTLYFKVLRIDPAQPVKDGRDYLILSKAHCSPALYATLALRGFFPMDHLYTYCTLGGLEGHLDMHETPGLEASGGSLGMGLSYSVGIAYALKLKERFAQRVYCIIGDGELSEGQIWEAAMSAGHYRLDNLIAVVDYNKVMAKGFVSDEMTQEPIAERWKSFGWNVIEVDGHEAIDLFKAFYRAKYLDVHGKPICIIAHTVKGRGIEECEFNYKWHTHAPSVNKAEEFLKELAASYNKPYEGIKRPPVKSDDGSLAAVIGGDIQ